MKNKEKYAKEIVEIACSSNGIAMHNGKICKCSGLPCSECDLNTTAMLCEAALRRWAESEYVEPRYEVDWSKVPVDTPVYLKGVSDNRR